MKYLLTIILTLLSLSTFAQENDNSYLDWYVSAGSSVWQDNTYDSFAPQIEGGVTVDILSWLSFESGISHQRLQLDTSDLSGDNIEVFTTPESAWVSHLNYGFQLRPVTFWGITPVATAQMAGAFFWRGETKAYAINTGNNTLVGNSATDEWSGYATGYSLGAGFEYGNIGLIGKWYTHPNEDAAHLQYVQVALRWTFK